MYAVPNSTHPSLSQLLWIDMLTGLQIIAYSNTGIFHRGLHFGAFIFDGEKVDKQATSQVSSGMTRNISSGPTKFLGHLQGAPNKLISCEAGNRFIKSFKPKLDNLDQAKVRGEYNIWIYKRYLIPSFLFALSIDSIIVIVQLCTIYSKAT